MSCDAVVVDQREQRDDAARRRVGLVAEDAFQVIGAGDGPFPPLLAAEQAEVLLGQQAQPRLPLQVVQRGSSDGPGLRR